MNKKVKNKKKSKNNNIFIIAIFAVIIALVFFLPVIYNFVEKLDLPEVEKDKNEETVKKKEVDAETLESLHYPLMRNSAYNKNTYYSLKNFSIKDMTNQDILLNAFLDIYSGNIVDSNVSGNCTNIAKQFNTDYMELRIKNILGKNISYTFENFYVPEDSKSNYSGEWNYDPYNSRYIYNGLCQTNQNGARYYNIEEFIKAKYDNKDIIVYYYVGFAKIEGNSYMLYSDPEMKNPLLNGSINDVIELNDIFKNINNKSKKTYKYTFKNTLCSYEEYCLYKGEWVNEF